MITGQATEYDKLMPYIPVNPAGERGQFDYEVAELNYMTLPPFSWQQQQARVQVYTTSSSLAPPERIASYFLPVCPVATGTETSSRPEAGLFDRRLLLSLLAFMVGGQTTSLQLELVVRYGRFEQVGSIYLLELPQITEVFILLDQEEYDDELMDHLLNEEVAVLDRYSNQLFNFHYFPLVRGGSVVLVPNNATLVFG